MSKTWDASESNPDVEIGDAVAKFDFKFNWTKDHLKRIQLEPLRFKGDKIGDTFIKFFNEKLLGQSEGEQSEIDLLESIEKWNSEKQQCPDQAKPFIESIYQVPSWINAKQVIRGQTLFWKYYPLSSMILTNLSLVQLLSTSKVFINLGRTSKNESQIDSPLELTEVVSMILEMMKIGCLSPGKDSWKACIELRISNAQYRTRFLNQNKDLDLMSLGTPINQEEMISTLAAFSVNLLVGLEKCGTFLNSKERDDFIAAWRYIAYLLGIDDTCNIFSSYSKSLAYLQSTYMSLPEKNTGGKRIIMNLLKQSSLRPSYKSLPTQVELTRLYLGPKYADSLDLPTYKFTKAILPFTLFFEVIIANVFAKFSPLTAINLYMNLAFESNMKISLLQNGSNDGPEFYQKEEYFEIKANPASLVTKALNYIFLISLLCIGYIVYAFGSDLAFYFNF